MAPPIDSSYGYGVTGAAGIDSLFSATLNGQAQLESMANAALNAGIDKFMHKDYAGAAEDFRRAVGIAPQGANATTAADYMANSYLKTGETEKALEAYETAVSLDPTRDDMYIKLGNLNFSLGRHSEAETAYRQAVALNSDATNIFSLGQLYLNTERPLQAVEQFEEVVNLTPENVNGYYGLGQAFGKMGDLEAAVGQFEKAIELQPDFYSSYAEIGYLYADMGQVEDAQAMFEILEDNDPALADTLSRYMYKTEAPRIEFASHESSFSYTLPAKTTLTALDSYLVNANTTKKFSMIFQFGKGMDLDSVQNRFNWQISRSAKTDPGQRYNNGLAIPTTEVTVPPIPEQVTFDPTKLQATVHFSISQNAALADGTLDPSHLVFKFSGVDEFGNKMDPDADEFMGVVGSV